MTVAEMIAELSKHPPDMPVYLHAETDREYYLTPVCRLSKMLETERLSLHEFPCDPAVNLSPPYFNAVIIGFE